MSALRKWLVSAAVERLSKLQEYDRLYHLDFKALQTLLARPTLPEGWVAALRSARGYAEAERARLAFEGAEEAAEVEAEVAAIDAMLSALPLPFGGGGFSPSDQRDRIPGEPVTANVDNGEAGE